MINYVHLDETRSISLHSTVDEEVAEEVIEQLYYLSESEGAIILSISTTGGCVFSGIAIAETIFSISNKVITIANGSAMSIGAFLVSCGTKGGRFTTNECKFMFHKPWSKEGGNLSEIEDELFDYLRVNLNKPKWRLKWDFRKERAFTAQQALKYGFVDAIIHDGIKDKNRTQTFLTTP
tara:strand:+ start:43265 stop:43801 length:537 start_codon:yes stop_codon:yes gene_type:complete